MSPASPQAKSLVDNIINSILKTEQRTRARKSDDAIAFKSAVGLIVGDLIIGLQTSEAGWSFLSLSTAAFSDRPIGYKTFKPTIKAMEAAGLIEISLGRNSQFRLEVYLLVFFFDMVSTKQAVLALTF